jgi:hypothetical protein
MNAPHDDPVLIRRMRVGSFVRLTKRIGYAALAAAIVAFGAGVLADFPPWTVTVAVVGLIASCVILPIPIVLGYGIRKAEREDPGASGHRG